MSRDPDDEALRWQGDDDPTLSPGWKTVGPSVDTSPDPAMPSEAAAPKAIVTDPTPDAARQVGSAELVLLGVFGGVYLLYTVGWILTVIGVANPGADPVAAFMFTVGLWLAVLAPAIWFLIAFVSTRGRARARLVWLLVGALLLVPIPFVIGVPQ